MAEKKPSLTPHTIKIIESIKSQEIRDLLLKGLHPSEVVEGWYYSLSLAIFKLQEGK